MQPVRRYGADRIAGAVIALLGAYIAWAATAYPIGTMSEPGPGLAPMALAVLLVGFGIVIVIGDVLLPAQRSVSFADLRHAIVILATLAAAAAVIERIGYRATVVAMFVFLVAVVERRNPFAAIAIGLGIALGSFYLIDNLLRVPLPRGPWGL